MVGAVGETASMKRRKLWKTGEDGLCCSSSAIQTRLDPSSLLEERSETPIVFVCFYCVVGYPPNWGKRPRYIDRSTKHGLWELDIAAAESRATEGKCSIIRKKKEF